MIPIAITDDDNLIAQLLKEFLSSTGSYDVLFTALNGHELIAKLNESEKNIPEVLLLDLKMEGMDGIETTKYLKIHFPSIKIIVISSYYQDSFMGFLIKTGASAFLPKEIAPDKIPAIIDIVHKQGVYFTDGQLGELRSQISCKSPKPMIGDELDLSSREIEVLKLICLQKTAKEIGEALFISSKTVEGHRNSLFIKTGVKNVVGLVIYAMQNKVIEIDSLGFDLK